LASSSTTVMHNFPDLSGSTTSGNLWTCCAATFRWCAEPGESSSSPWRYSKRFENPSCTHNLPRSNSASATRKSAMAPCSLRRRSERRRDDSRAWIMRGSPHAFSRPPRTHGIAAWCDFPLPRLEPRSKLSARSSGHQAHREEPSSRVRRARSKTPRFRVKRIRHPSSLPVNRPIFPATDPRTVHRAGQSPQHDHARPVRRRHLSQPAGGRAATRCPQGRRESSRLGPGVPRRRSASSTLPRGRARPPAGGPPCTSPRPRAECARARPPL
jgi:hypothetical protein